MPEIGPPGSESGGRKRTHGTRPAARLRKRRISHRPLPATRLSSTLLNQPVADFPSVSGAFRRIGSLCRRCFAPESPRTAPVFASTRPPRRPLRGPVRRFRVAGTTAPDPIAFVQHAATCAGIPARYRYRGHALPRMAEKWAGFHDVVSAVRDPEHGPSVGVGSTPREGRSARARVRGLPRDQALEAPAAAVGDHRSPARGAVQLAGRRGPRGAGRRAGGGTGKGLKAGTWRGGSAETDRRAGRG